MTNLLDVEDVRLCLLGFGGVTQRFCEIVHQRREQLADEQGLRLLITAVGTATHGSWSDAVGQTPGQMLELYREGKPGFPSSVRPGPELIGLSKADVLVESTPLEYDGHTAIEHVEAAFRAGLDVITVNKGPVAWAYERLRTQAEALGRRFRFEGVTMDGCPIYNLAEFCLTGDRVVSFRGVLNSTTNYVLDAMAEGATVAEAIVEAQEEGITETDPSYDIDGFDAASKVAALANVLINANITPDDVERHSISDLTPDDVARVVAYGRRLRVICQASRNPGETDAGKVTASVTLEPIKSDDPMYWIRGTSSALVLQTELAGTVEIIERNGLLSQTAYAIYADMLTLYGRR